MEENESFPSTTCIEQWETIVGKNEKLLEWIVEHTFIFPYFYSMVPPEMQLSLYYKHFDTHIGKEGLDGHLRLYRILSPHYLKIMRLMKNYIV